MSAMVCESSCLPESNPLQESADKSSITLMKKHSRKTRSVQFSKMVKVATIPHIKDFSTDEISQIWFTEEEHAQCRASCMKIIRRMDQQADTMGSCSSDHSSDVPKGRSLSRHTRGLESFGKTRGIQRRVRRLAATDAILTEQSFQQEEGYNDPEFLRQLYQQISAPCQMEAHMIGLQDEKEAMRCNKSPESSPRVTRHAGASKSSTSTLQAVNTSSGRIDRPRS